MSTDGVASKHNVTVRNNGANLPAILQQLTGSAKKRVNNGLLAPRNALVLREIHHQSNTPPKQN
jgi:hypothetical protein